MEQSLDDLHDRASQRARTALARAHELSNRLAELRETQPGDAGIYDRAVGAARLALTRAESAVKQAAVAHHTAAKLHRRTAEACDRAGRADRAAEHRRLAILDDAAGDADDAAVLGG